MEPVVWCSIATLFYLVAMLGAMETWFLSVSATGTILSYLAVSNMLYMLGATPFKLAIIGDGCFCFAALMIAITYRYWWCWIVTAMYLTAVLLDAFYFNGKLAWSPFMIASNTSFMVLLFAASFPGVKAVVWKMWSTLFTRNVKRAGNR